MEPAIERIVVFAVAFRAHRKSFHARRRAVIGQVFDDREPGSAIRAIGEWVSIPAIGRIEDLLQAIGAGGDVRQHENRLLSAVVALPDLE